MGDFNKHINQSVDCVATEFLNISESVHFERVSEATHMGTNQMDLFLFENICCEDLMIGEH